MEATISPAHPLEPLTARELAEAVAIVRRTRELSGDVRFVITALDEPDADELAAFDAGGTLVRRAHLVLLDRATGEVHEARVDLGAGRLTGWDPVPPEAGQPAITVEEYDDVERIVKRDERWCAAMRRRGVESLEHVQVDGLSAGHFDLPEEAGRRLVRAVAYVRDRPGDNGYARPVEGLVAYVDLNARRVDELVDGPGVPIPVDPGAFDAQAIGRVREGLRPLSITQPEGPSFTISGSEVRWQKWRLRVSFNQREGLVLHQIGYEDAGRLRPILHRAAISEMVVPYADPSPDYFWRSYFDAGEYGLGRLANSLVLGCDCLGEIRYLDAEMVDDHGRPYTLGNAICLHEEDTGILWKHTDAHTGRVDVRRSRRLVISFFATVGNYDYGFYWYLYQDGTIAMEMKLTGIILTAAVGPGAATTPHASRLAGGLTAPYHQHLFGARLDFTLDGPLNSVYELEAVPIERGPGNPHGNAFGLSTRQLSSEAHAVRLADTRVGRSWKIVNPDVRNGVGEAVGYRLLPEAAPVLLADPDSSLGRRAAFARNHLWVTRRDRGERYISGEYPNQHPGGSGVDAWAARDRSLDRAPLVVWHTFGSTHFPRLEDWPVMPVERVGFTLKPAGFFDRNPALDVPPPGPAAHQGHCHPPRDGSS